MRILFLFTALSGFKRSNHLMFHNAFRARGWEVAIGRVNSLAMEKGVVHGDLVEPGRDIAVGDDFEDRAAYRAITDFDLVWVMNQPHEGLRTNAYQMLWSLSRRIPFVNSIESIVFLNNKNTLAHVLPAEARIDSYASASADRLREIMAEEGGDWIIKPTNDGNGTNVFVLRPEDTNRIPLLQSMTGNEITQQEIHGRQNLGIVRDYALLQRFIPNARECEKRVVLAGGRVVRLGDKAGVYQTVFKADDHRSNRIHTPDKLHVGLTEEEERICADLGERLLAHGVRFTAIDMAAPYIFEINVVNPGGLQTIDLISGLDLTPVAVDQILEALAPEIDRTASVRAREPAFA